MISVLIPAYNCRLWIEESLRSVVGQTLVPDEILVADDASTDGTADFVESLGLPGVRVLRSERNLGISRQLNRMIGEAKGRYLVRMDGDDIAHPDRFRTQLDAMERDRVGVMGTWSRRFGASCTVHRFPTSDETIKAGLLFSVPFCHPTVIMDRDSIRCDLRYDPEYDYAEDYHLWVRLRAVARFGNVPHVLLEWRMHDRNAGTAPSTAAKQRELSTRIRIALLAEYGIVMPDANFRVLNDRAVSRTLEPAALKDYLDALLLIVRADHSRMDVATDALRRLAVEQWDLACAFSAWDRLSVPWIWAAGRRRLGSGIPARNALVMAYKSVLGFRRA